MKTPSLRIYIASSWRNRHGVEMLADILAERGHEVACFTRQPSQPRGTLGAESAEWFDTQEAAFIFDHDISFAITSELVIYYGPAGCDAWAEVGAAAFCGSAFGPGPAIYGLLAKGEQIGINRLMVHKWFTDYKKLLAAVDDLAEEKAA